MEEIDRIMNAIKIAFSHQTLETLEHTQHIFFPIINTSLEHEGSNDFIFSFKWAKETIKEICHLNSA